MARAAKAQTGSVLPVLSYATGAGWCAVGHARSPAGARRVIRALLPDSSRSLIERYGFQLLVSERTPLQQELNGGPAGYIWSVGK